MEQDNNIDWKKIFHAYEFYESHGFKNCNVDWIVESEYTDVTKPIEIDALKLKDLDLIGSAEQIFIKMIARGFFNDDTGQKFKNGKYMALTPCFRNELILDRLHRQYFVKLELLVLSEWFFCDSLILQEVIATSVEFFRQYLDVDVLQTGEDQYDIVDAKTGLELGSYGIRKWKERQWIYATGLAEPRLSTVMEIVNEK